jgi:hypothetical protein
MAEEFLSIDKFMQQYKNGFAKPNLFEVTIANHELNLMSNDGTAEGLRFACHSAQIPAFTMATTDKDMGFRSIGYRKIYDDVSLSFYCGENMGSLEFFNNWMEIISNPLSNRVEYYQNYVTTVDITQFNRLGDKTLKTTLYEAYPKKIDATGLDYNTTNAVMSINITLTYRYHKQKYYHPDSSVAAEQRAAGPFRWGKSVPSINPVMGIFSKESQDQHGHGGHDDTEVGEG